MKAQRPQSGVNPQIGRNGFAPDVARVERDFGVAIEESGPEEELPQEAAHDFPEKCLPSLYQRQLHFGSGENAGPVNVVIQVSVSVARRDLIPVFLKKELPTQSESAAAVVGVETRRPNCRRRGYLVAPAEGKNITQNRYDSGSQGGA